MDLKTFRKKCTHETDSLFPLLFVDPISTRLAYYSGGKIEPDNVTWSRILFLPLIIIIAVSQELYLLAALFGYIFILTDSLDGQIARGWDKKSKRGAFLDSVGDRIGGILTLVVGFMVSFNLLKDGYAFAVIPTSMFFIIITIKTVHLMIITQVYYYKEQFGILKDKSDNKMFKSNIFHTGIIGKINSLAKYIRKDCNAIITTGYERFVGTLILPLILIGINTTTSIFILLTIYTIFTSLFAFSLIMRISKLLAFTDF